MLVPANCLFSLYSKEGRISFVFSATSYITSLRWLFINSLLNTNSKESSTKARYVAYYAKTYKPHYDSPDGLTFVMFAIRAS